MHDQESEKVELAELNRTAANRARLAAAFSAAKNHAELGLSLIGRDAWDQHDALRFDLYQELAWSEQALFHKEASQEIWSKLKIRSDSGFFSGLNSGALIINIPRLSTSLITASIVV